MRRTPVQSSSIRSVGYDAPARDLEIQYEGGAVYRYHGVSRATWRDLLNAPSKGRYVNYRIKPKFAYSKVKDA